MKSNMGAIFKSERQNWKTPKAFYQALDAEFEFDFDPCPTNPTFDGLADDWGERNFVNPPYKELNKWVSRAFDQWKKHNRVSVLLIPARTDTRWWHDYCMKAAEIRFIKGRLNFDDGAGRATFPSCLVIFK